MKDGFSQTSDESTDESGDLDEDDEENVMMTPSTSISLDDRPLSKSILNRMTSAQIRQFVSPDFREDPYHFHAPSLAASVKLKGHLKTTSSKTNPKKRSKAKLETIKRLGSKSNNESQESDITRKMGKAKKARKEMLERLCLPTLSFILKTRRENVKVTNEPTLRKSQILLEPIKYPCERFNRRNSP